MQAAGVPGEPHQDETDEVKEEWLSRNGTDRTFSGWTQPRQQLEQQCNNSGFFRCHRTGLTNSPIFTLTTCCFSSSRQHNNDNTTCCNTHQELYIYSFFACALFLVPETI
mmetsp:Transcript_58512/g.119035  ORF Transcript_58512/g.119035 Transcript_58512/m.119035 type:complete len:110 (+) Transcript_58512:719-1048(+)